MNNLSIIFQFSIPFGVISFFFLELISIQFYSKTRSRHYRKKLQSDIMDPHFLFCFELLSQKCENSMVGFRGACGIYLGFPETRKTDTWYYQW